MSKKALSCSKNCWTSQIIRDFGAEFSVSCSPDKDGLFVDVFATSIDSFCYFDKKCREKYFQKFFHLKKNEKFLNDFSGRNFQKDNTNAQ